MVTMFDRLDLEELYNLVMQRFESTTPEGVDLVFWGDLRTMFDANTEDELWQNQERWNLKSWNFHENYGVHTLTLEDGTEIYMLAERKYPLTKETLERMMSLKLIAESASESAYNLLRFIQKHIDEYGSYDGKVMKESLPNMVDDHVKELTKTQVLIYVAQGLIMERKQNQADVAKMVADAIQKEQSNLWANITSQINNAITNHIPSQVDSSVRNYMSGHILHVHPTQASQAFAQEHQYQLYLTMKDNPQLQHDDLPILLALKIKFEGLHASNTPCRSSAIRPRDQDNPHDDAHPEGEHSAKRQKTSEHETYVFGESSSSQDNESEPGPSTSGNQEQLDGFDFQIDTYATDDDELPAEKV
ncbi:hypothetical protein Tco_0099892 [Tanacetum coccineum]